MIKPTWGGRRKGSGRKPEMKSSTHLAVHIPGPVYGRFRREAMKKERPLSVHVREILKAARPDLPWG